MSEGKGEMPKVEGENRPTSPEGNKGVEKPISQYSFREVFALEKKLERQQQIASGDALSEITAKLSEVTSRKNQLRDEVEDEGGFMPLEQDLDPLRLMLNSGNLSPSDIRDELKKTPRLDINAGLNLTDPHAGVREWYFRKRLDEILEDLKKTGGTFKGSGLGKEEVLERIATAVETQVEKEEPGIERILIPETAGKCVKVVEDRLFGLLDKAITEKKQTKEFADEFKAIEGFIKRISEDPRYKGSKDPLHKGIEEPSLSRHSFARFPEGVYLKEKLTLLLEAMRNLTDRVVEVENAEGSLLKLGAVKSEVALAKELQISFTNINPVNWYVLTHLGKLFPEAGSIPETEINIQAAWEEWRNIGDKPYSKFLKWDKDVEEEKNKYDLEPILTDEGDLIPKDKRHQVGQALLSKKDKKEAEEVKKEIEKKKKEGKSYADIKPRSFDISDFYTTLESIYRSEAAEQMVRSAIAKKTGGGKVTTEGVRSELLAWCFLKVGLTFDMWDRKRWKIKADNGVRDLMWFPYKQILRMAEERSGGGVLDTAGSYWAYEDQWKVADRFKDRLGGRAEEILRILKRNEEKRKVFLIEGDWKAEGTVVGDFWSSTAFSEAYTEDGKEKTRKVRLKDKKERKLEEIPWLKPESQIEDGTYSGYFGYSLGMANAVVESFMNAGGRGWGVEEFVSQAFWRRETDLIIRLSDFCPIMITKDKKLIKDERGIIVDRGNNEERIQLLARTFARGIFWLGSYKAQPPRDFLGIPLPRKGLYTYDQVREILRAIKGAGFLTEEYYNGLLRDVQEYNFFKRGASPQQRR